jgi:hypothetical protein
MPISYDGYYDYDGYDYDGYDYDGYGYDDYGAGYGYALTPRGPAVVPQRLTNDPRVYAWRRY